MSTAPRPCPHCGNQNLVFVPNMLIDIAKGASGGAVQAANVALGLPETAGLSMIGLYP